MLNRSIKDLLLLCFLALPFTPKAQVNPADSTTTHQFTIGTLIFPERSNSLVTDYTETLSSEEIKKLEYKLEAFNSERTAQIAIVIMQSTGSNDIMFYGTQLARRWGIGYKNINNGVLVLVAMADRNAAILTGAGIEKTLPDELCHKIIESDLIPNFKKQQYYTGLDECTNSLMRVIAGKK